MKHDEFVRWVLSLCGGLRLSQAKTLSVLALAALGLTRASLAGLGRGLAGLNPVAVKHCIKRVDRFIGNSRVEPLEAMRGVVAAFARPGQRLVVSLDWVDIRSFWCLMLAARVRGRAVPLVWAVYRPEDIFRSRNSIEEGLLKALRTMMPSDAGLVLLADRGFGRAEMARQCQDLGFDYLIRIQPTVYVAGEAFTGVLGRLPIRPGQSRVLRDVWYRRKEPVRQHVAVLWKKGEEEPWFLMTSLVHVRASLLAKLYAVRMTIEEYFRDTKSLRNGFALRLTLVQDAQRLGRLLLVLALAYLWIVAVGRHALAHGHPRQWCSNNRAGECSLFAIGHIVLGLACFNLPPPRTLLNALKRESWLKGNWG
jgi:Transposase DDE domain